MMSPGVGGQDVIAHNGAVTSPRWYRETAPAHRVDVISGPRAPTSSPVRARADVISGSRAMASSTTSAR
ncbi:unnamed protein product [Lampetra planeri]